MGSNINSSATGVPVWDQNQPGASIQKLHDYVEAQAKGAIGWYYSRKSRKALLSTWTRLLTIVLTALGGLIPILSAILYNKDADQFNRLWLHQWGYLAIGLAGLSLALDRFYGASSGWMRYIGTAMGLETLLEEFRLDWSKLWAALGSGQPNAAQVAEFLDRLKTFSLAVRALVEKETQAWISEFQSNLTQLEKETKEALDAAREQARKDADAVEKARREASDAQRQGAINLTIKATSVEGAFKVEVDGRVYRDGVTGATCGIINIPPGLHEVGVSGKGGYASKVVTVKGHTVEPVEIEVR